MVADRFKVSVIHIDVVHQSALAVGLSSVNDALEVAKLGKGAYLVPSVFGGVHLSFVCSAIEAVSVLVEVVLNLCAARLIVVVYDSTRRASVAIQRTMSIDLCMRRVLRGISILADGLIPYDVALVAIEQEAQLARLHGLHFFTFVAVVQGTADVRCQHLVGCVAVGEGCRAVCLCCDGTPLLVFGDDFDVANHVAVLHGAVSQLASDDTSTDIRLRYHLGSVNAQVLDRTVYAAAYQTNLVAVVHRDGQVLNDMPCTVEHTMIGQIDVVPFVGKEADGDQAVHARHVDVCRQLGVGRRVATSYKKAELE